MSNAKKLTLRLDAELIQRAKQYAVEHGTSVSLLVANYFQALTAPKAAPEEEDWADDLAPHTRQLLGLLEGSSLDEADYYRHLEEKHLGSVREEEAS